MAWKMMSFVVTLFLIIISKKKVSSLCVAFTLLCIYLFLITIISDASVHGCFVRVFQIIPIALIYELYSDELYYVIKLQVQLLTLLLLVNLLTIIAFPGGMDYAHELNSLFYHNFYFLQHDNSMCRWSYPALTMSLVHARKTKSYFGSILLLGIMCASAILTWSGQNIVILFVGAISFVIFRSRTRIFNYYNYWFLQLLFFVGIVLFRLQNYFSWLIEDILGKSTSMSARTLIWDNTLKRINMSPWIGYGIQDDNTRVHLLGGYVGTSQGHNLIVQILYEGGVIYFIFMISIIIIVGRKIYPYRNTYIGQTLSFYFLLWAFQGMVEGTLHPLMIGMFTLAYYCGNLIEEEKREIDVIGYDNHQHVNFKVAS